jgi:hypothetical protein
MLKWIATVLLAIFVVTGRPAHAEDRQVDLLLVLAADISRSVDDRKFKLQRDGYVSAIADPRVIRAMTSGPTGRIALCFFEWASANEQNVIVDWVTISGENDARDVAQSIAQGTESICRPHIYQCRFDYGLEQLARSSHQASRRHQHLRR